MPDCAGMMIMVAKKLGYLNIVKPLLEPFTMNAPAIAHTAPPPSRNSPDSLVA